MLNRKKISSKQNKTRYRKQLQRQKSKKRKYKQLITNWTRTRWFYFQKNAHFQNMNKYSIEIFNQLIIDISNLYLPFETMITVDICGHIQILFGDQYGVWCSSDELRLFDFHTHVVPCAEFSHFDINVSLHSKALFSIIYLSDRDQYIFFNYLRLPIKIYKLWCQIWMRPHFKIEKDKLWRKLFEYVNRYKTQIYMVLIPENNSEKILKNVKEI